MRLYELVLVLRSSLSETQRKKILDTIKSWLKPASPSSPRASVDARRVEAGQGGPVKISKEEEWGQKVLSYVIKKESSGFYVLWSLEADLVPADFEKRLLMNENILRHLLIRKK